MLNPSQLESSLWEATERLLAKFRLSTFEYSLPVLGLILLRYVNNRYEAVRAEIEQTLPSRGGKKRALTSADFESKAAICLPEIARYDYLLTLSKSEGLGHAIDEAMRAVESESALLKGVLPKSYAALDREIVDGLIQIFGQIFGRNELGQATDDVFESIYEYFLDKFAMSGAREGVEFYTPPSLVKTIVGVVEPRQGVVLDPACGSAGMLVQTGHYLRSLYIQPSKKVTLYGQELSETNTRLAKINLAMHRLDGNIYHGNTFYNSRFELMGECDYVMSNPPFNVDMVDSKKIKEDKRLFTEQKIPGVRTETKAVSNANYLWIQYFYSYLKPERGRAGFVMPSSASDARYGEKEIRDELIATGDVDIIISVGTNFFYTRSLPCTLWFFDKGKPDSRKDNVLMIDAREIYRVVSRKTRDFSPEQFELIQATVWLYRGQTRKYKALIQSCFDRVRNSYSSLRASLYELEGIERDFVSTLANVDNKSEGKNSSRTNDETFEKLRMELTNAVQEMHVRRDDLLAFFDANANILNPFNGSMEGVHSQNQYIKTIQKLIDDVPKLQRSFRVLIGVLSEVNNFVQKILGNRTERENLRHIKSVSQAMQKDLEHGLDVARKLLNSFQQLDTLNEYFPNDRIADVAGFCRVVSREEIREQDSSLNPGNYVGVTPAQPVEGRIISRLRESVEDWNQWRERERGIRPNLTGADLSNLYLKKADLSNAILNDAIFDHSILRGAILQGVEGKGASFRNADMRKVDLRESMLIAANIKEANLAEANLYSADLRDAQIMRVNLKGANLSEARVLRTNFHSANLTGACIADWQLGDTTLLDNVECAYIFRKLNPLDAKADAFQSRLPVDRESIFKAGEFSQRFQILQNASETIDLTFTEGVDWNALFSALQAVRAENVGKNISVQKLEQKESTFVVSLAVDSDVDIESIDRKFNAYYHKMMQFLEDDNKRLRGEKDQLQSRHDQLQIELINVVRTMSEQSQPQTINNNFHSPNIGNFANSVQGGQIGGTVNIYGAKMEDITQLIASLRSHVQTLPKEHQEAALDALEDLETDVSKPNLDTNKVARRFRQVVSAFTMAGVLAAGTAQFSGDIKSTLDNLSEIVKAPVELVLPESGSASSYLPES